MNYYTNVNKDSRTITNFNKCGVLSRMMGNHFDKGQSR